MFCVRGVSTVMGRPLMVGLMCLFKYERMLWLMNQTASPRLSFLLKSGSVSPFYHLPQSLTFYYSVLTFAAHYTTSNAIARILHLLALHPQVQSKLRQEILSYTSGGAEELGYDELMAVPYLDAVVRETMRLYVLHQQIIIYESDADWPCFRYAPLTSGTRM